MPVAATDIEFRYSGGSGNTDPNACLGGAISTSGSGLIDNAIKNDIFDDVSAAEALAGDVEYRGFYIKNIHGTLAFQDCRLYMSADSAQTDDTIDIAIGGEAINTTMETVANENTAPVGETFTHPTTYAGGLALNSTTGLVAGAYKSAWLKRTTGAAAASGSITNTLKCEGLTA